MKRAFLLLALLTLVGALGACSVTSPHTPPENGQVAPVGASDSGQPELPGAFMVMIDNHAAARPQAALAKADLVYEIICEASITRFLAGFHSRDPGVVGPIRSIRYYYLHVARAYDLPLAHVGGSGAALALRAPLGIKSICAITNSGKTFYKEAGCKSPHSTFAKSEAILDAARGQGRALAALPELARGDFVGEGEAAAKLTVSYGKDYWVVWAYDEDENCYRRLVKGQEDQDRVFKGDNIIIIEAPVKTVRHPQEGVQSEINLLGRGKALFIREGKLARGQWSKADPQSHFKYTLEDGSEFVYGQGNVWVMQVHSLEQNVAIE